MTKAEYLQLAADWKAEYAALTIKSRQDKHDYKGFQREFAKCGSYDYGRGQYDSEHNVAHRAAERNMHGAMSQCATNKYKATEMIEQRWAMKAEAGRAMQEQFLGSGGLVCA